MLNPEKFFRYSIVALLIGSFFLSMSISMAAGSSLHKIVNGTNIYLGVLPAEMVRGHPKEHPESHMHGGVPPGTHYHIMVALFDNKTGERIKNATVTATVKGTATVEISKSLDPMLVGGTSTYGNYFKMAGHTPQHRITLEIKLPDSGKSFHTTFEWAQT